jgi:ribosomal protein S18 acetylase RimI-like enzyme
VADTAVDPIVSEIERAFVAQWSLIGQWPGARLVDEDGVLRFETPIRKLPYNGVIRTSIEERAEVVVERITADYARRGAEFFWLIHPSARPDGLAEHLGAVGLDLVETATGMSLELDTWEPSQVTPPPAVELAEVVDEDGLRAYEDILMTYWELDEADRDHVSRLNRHWSGSRAQGHRWVVLLEGRPAGKGYLSLAGPPGVASIYGMSVRPEARGMGIAGALTQTLVAQAKSLGCRRVVLHSSAMAVGVYRRAGFVERCPLVFFATAPIWSGKH